MNSETLAAELHAAGHLRDPEWPPSAERAAGSRWILALQIAGGWLAAVFLLAFLGVGAAPLIRGAPSWIVLGVVLSASAGFVAAHASGTLLRQMLLIVGLAGHCALLYGAERFDRGLGLIMASAYEMVLLLVVAWSPYRLIAGLAACGALLAGIAESSAQAYVPSAIVVLWLSACVLGFLEPRWFAKRHGAALQTLACALFVSSLLWIEVYSLDHHGHIPPDWIRIFQISDVAFAAVNAVFAVLLARPLLADWRGRAGIVLLLAVLALTWTAPAIGMGAIAMTLGFSRGHAWLAWLGGAMLVYGVSRFYYDMQTTLLIKSGLMVAGGFLLLAVRALLAGGERR